MGVQEAEQMRESDQRKKDTVQAKNDAETLGYSVEKQLTDLKEKMSTADADALKKNLDELKKKTQELQEKSWKVTQEAYQSSSSEQTEEKKDEKDEKKWGDGSLARRCSVRFCVPYLSTRL